jgi:hypothetical protein
MLHSPRVLKSIEFRLSNNIDETAIDNFINYLEIIGQDVTKITLKYDATLYQLKRVIEALPKLEFIKLIQLKIAKNDEKIVEVETKNVNKIWMEFNLGSHEDMANTVDGPFEIFCNHFKFPDGSLEHFMFTANCDYLFNCNFDKKSADKFLDNQKQLTVVKIGWQNDYWEGESWDETFCYEAKMMIQK